MNTKFNEIELALLQWLKKNCSTSAAQFSNETMLEDFRKEVVGDKTCEMPEFIETMNNLVKEGFVVTSKSTNFYLRNLPTTVFIDITEKGLTALREQ